jgi:hypothetical protein
VSRSIAALGTNLMQKPLHRQHLRVILTLQIFGLDRTQAVLQALVPVAKRYGHFKALYPDTL